MSSFGAVQLYKVAELAKLGVTREGFMVPVLVQVSVCGCYGNKEGSHLMGVATKGFTQSD